MLTRTSRRDSFPTKTVEVSHSAKPEYGRTFSNPCRKASSCFARPPPHFVRLSGRRDSNPESPVPKTGMLAVTPRPDIYFSKAILLSKSTRKYEKNQNIFSIISISAIFLVWSKITKSASI
jgi:hypothetical protein